ncbi:CDP-alcohol phosphatidyltransferase family protein [Jannaschia marina]|uniref:CDP-alcohol phosphatidyltransferase family protein n=1 Tax=Jannaschia marina TaxID=2741674 RepID=UPI002E2B2FF2|nr:CDP-alcohol phosphatidyltransferase family protein [Jannaschia marina]
MSLRDDPVLPAPSAPAPALRLATAGAGLAILLGLLTLAIAPEGLAAGLAVYLLGVAVAVRGMARAYPHDRLGGCNLVTTARLALVGAVAAVGVAQGPGWTLAGLALLALLLDGTDGWLARRQGLVSRFGAAYDMEVDAALAACLALVLLAAGRAGPELLILGFARYAFVAAAWIWPWLAAALAESFRRKAICVVQIATLVALATPLGTDGPARALSLVAAALLVWSFARDIRRLRAAR